MIGADDRGVVDGQDKVERDERARPHDDPDAAVVDDLSVVELHEGVGVPARRADGLLPLDALQRGEDRFDGITAEAFGGLDFRDVHFELKEELGYINSS